MEVGSLTEHLTEVERHLAMFSNNNNSVDDNNGTTTAASTFVAVVSCASGTTPVTASASSPKPSVLAETPSATVSSSPGVIIEPLAGTPAQAGSAISADERPSPAGGTGPGPTTPGLGGSLGTLSAPNAPVASGVGGGGGSSTLPLGVEHSPLSQSSSQSGGKLNQEENIVVAAQDMHTELLSLMGLDQLQLPEMETFEVELVKDQQGLGITIAGYVCEKGRDEEISGVFVKSVAKGSAADLNGHIRINDQVIEVDGRPLQGYTNHQAVELLRSTGKVVKLRLARYLRGARYDQLQQAIMAESVHAGAGQQLISTAQMLQTQSMTATAAAAVSAPPVSQPVSASPLPTGSIGKTNRFQLFPTTSSSTNNLTSSSCATLAATTIQPTTNAAANPLNNNSNSNNNGPSNNTINNCSSGTSNARNNNSGTPSGNASSYAPKSSVALANLDNLIRGTHHLPASGLTRLGSVSGGAITTQENEKEKIAKWTAVFGAEDYTIVVAQLCKFHEGGGLGISLEGTVDVNEAGEEIRPHHYIRSVLPDGPVGLNGVLRSGDELIEVNGRQLLGLDHRDVVMTLKDLPLNVEMVCARPKKPLPASVTSCSPTPMTPGAGGLHGPHGHHHASKAKSDTSLNRYSSEDEESGGGCSMGFVSTSGSYAGIGSNSGGGSGANNKLNKLRSRSLEPLSGLAMWSNEPQLIELHKAERGLGFSILDYQDPMNPNETVIVIRSLVPGGVAQQDGRLIPGDRLLFVNDVNLENASLDAAVQALKGAAKGPVRIGVAKPLPLPCPHDGNNGANGASAGDASAGQTPLGETGTLAALVKSESF